jgi:ParB family chromosome partitioning protein
MARKSGGLGRDFYSLLDDNMPENKKNGVSTLRIADIEPRSDQPRKIFEREALETLAESIGTHGVLQPIIVRENAMLKGTYEIIAGERRWRASKMAGLSEIPVVILDGDDLKAAQVSIIENIQRENLNPVEEALAYRTLMDKFDLTQDQVAAQVGKSRSNVANMMRLLDLPDTVLDMLRENLLATGHARALLGLEREEDMVLLAERIVQTEMTVREVERAVKAMNDVANAPDNVAEEVAETAESKLRRVHMRDLERRILEKMGRKAKITNSPKKRVIELTYDSDEDLEDLLRALCGNDFFAEE